MTLNNSLKLEFHEDHVDFFEADQLEKIIEMLKNKTPQRLVVDNETDLRVHGDQTIAEEEDEDEISEEIIEDQLETEIIAFLAKDTRLQMIFFIKINYLKKIIKSKDANQNNQNINNLN